MPSEAQHYRKIMVGVDGSEEAESALFKAIEIAKRNKSELLIVHVIDTRIYTMGLASAEFEGSGSGVEEAKKMLAQYKEKASNAGLNRVGEILEKGSPKNLLAQNIPVEQAADLIVIGQSGLNAMERFMLGSVSGSVIQHARCDVLVTRNQEEKRGNLT